MYRICSSSHSSLLLRPQLAPLGLTIAAITRAAVPWAGDLLRGAIRAKH